MFFDNFVRLCEQKGVKPSRALTEAGVPKSAYSYWRTEAGAGNDAKPTNQNAVKLAQYFDVTVDYLLTGNQKENPPQQLSQDGQDIVDYLVKRFDGMSEEDKKLEMNRIQSYIYSEIQKMI